MQKTAQPAMIGADQVAYLRTHQGAGSLRMFAYHHFVPETHLIDCLHLDQERPLDLAGLGRHAPRFFDRLAQTPGLPVSGGVLVARRRQHKMTGPFQLTKRLHAAARLRYSPRIKKTEVRAHGAGCLLYTSDAADE